MPNRSYARSLVSAAVALVWLAVFSTTTALARAPIPEGGVVALGGSLSQTGGLVTVTAKVKIAPGFHINAHEPDEPYLIPTVLRIEAGELSFDKIDYPDPKSETFPFSPDKPMLVYEGGFEIEVEPAE